MIMNAFPRTQGALSRESYLTLLILALVNQCGGELRLSSQSLESLDSGGKLLVDWDSSAQQLILRAGSPTLVVAEVRGSGWIQPTATLQPQPTGPDPSKHRVMTEEQVLDALEKRMQAQRMREWREAGAATVASMPPPDETNQ